MKRVDGHICFMIQEQVNGCTSAFAFPRLWLCMFRDWNNRNETVCFHSALCAYYLMHHKMSLFLYSVNGVPMWMLLSSVGWELVGSTSTFSSTIK